MVERLSFQKIQTSILSLFFPRFSTGKLLLGETGRGKKKIITCHFPIFVENPNGGCNVVTKGIRRFWGYGFMLLMFLNRKYETGFIRKMICFYY